MLFEKVNLEKTTFYFTSDSEVKGTQEILELSKTNEARKGRMGDAYGTKRRRKTWYAAKSSDEARTAIEPEISEWGNPLHMQYL